ncbi:MAG: cell division protein FtsQ/DivIB [Gammaproteobacteria bacterium]|nr:cell division protein FtsQ/DivIB [Gammaproteobacteria bacterium]
MKRRRRRARAWGEIWRHRYLRRGLAGVAGLAVIFTAHTLWGSVTLMERTQFPFRMLRMEGSFAHVTSAELSAIVAPYAAAGFFETDVQAIKRALEELPWVERASVRRVWPDVLQVTVTEERAVARWQGGGLVNPAGQVFDPGALAAEERKLPLLEGPPRTSTQVMGAYARMNEQIAPQGIAITRLSMDARRSWRLTLDNGMHLILGRKDGERQLERFARFYPGTLAGRVADVEEVDLRYTNGFAVKWRLSGNDAARRPGAKNTGDKA